MALVTSIEDVQKWFYSINELTIYTGGTTTSIPSERITKIGLKYLFEENFFPVFSLTLVLESSKYYTILKNKKTSYFKINIEKGYRYNGSEEDSLMRTFINQNFSLILDDDDIDSNSTTKRLEASDDYESMMKTDENDLYYTDNEVTFYLFPTSTIDASKKTVNAILKNCTLMDAANYILSEANFQKVIMTPFENTEEKELIVIPPMPASKALQFLDSYYGFYRSGAMYFSDYDYMYILKYNSDVTAFTDGEKTEVDIIIPDIESEDMSDICGTIPETSTIYNIVAIPSNIAIRNASVSTNAISGTDILSIDNYTGDIQKSEAKVETGSGVSNTKIVSNETENAWITDIHASQTEASSTVVTVTLNDFDISVLKPNRRYKIIFENPVYTEKYNGLYMLVGFDSSFVKNGTNLTVSAICTFKRITTKE